MLAYPNGMLAYPTGVLTYPTGVLTYPTGMANLAHCDHGGFPDRTTLQLRLLYHPLQLHSLPPAGRLVKPAAFLISAATTARLTNHYGKEDQRVEAIYYIHHQAAAAIALLLALAGCASEPSMTPGTYTSSITREDTTSNVFIGEWELMLTDGNGYSLTKDGQWYEEGSYTLTQDQIEFTTQGLSDCSATGTYQWASDGKELTLTKVEDQCEGRPTVFTMRPWSRQD
jgi:hypothetical protein